MNTVNNNQAPDAYQLLVTKCGKWVECSKADFDCVRANPGMWPDIKVRALYVESLQSGGITPDWKLVPVRPTPEMLEQLRYGWSDISTAHVFDRWKRTVAAVPQTPTTEQYSAVQQPQVEQEPAGETEFMPGTTGFTMACFRASDAPVGTKLYTHPQPPRQPLTDKRIDELLVESALVPVVPLYKTIARAVEREHRIGQSAAPQQPQAAADDAQEQCRTALQAIEKLNGELGKVSDQRDVLLEALKHIARMTTDGYAERHALEAIAEVSVEGGDV
jgi:hypothetical protein